MSRFVTFCYDIINSNPTILLSRVNKNGARKFDVELWKGTEEKASLSISQVYGVLGNTLRWFIRAISGSQAGTMILYYCQTKHEFVGV